MQLPAGIVTQRGNRVRLGEHDRDLKSRGATYFDQLPSPVTVDIRLPIEGG